MTGLTDSTAKILDSLKRWQWERYNPDGELISDQFEMAEIVNRLAFQGHVNPEPSVLELLCAGEITAFCNYSWLKYQRGQRYQMTEYMSVLEPAKWKIVAELRQDEIRQLEDNEWPNPFINLEKLEMQDCEILNWSPSNSRVAYALCPPDTSVYHPTYFEEWLSATAIHIGRSFSVGQPDLSASDSELDVQNSPPLSQSELLKWWGSKAPVRDLLSKDELLALVRAKYPDKSITRERIRNLVGSRKRGPKQFRD